MNEILKFELISYNPRLAARGAEAAEVRVTWPDGDSFCVWMSRRDVKNNIKERGASKGLLDALEAYKVNKKVDFACVSDSCGQQ
jgi:hypothetical protein